MRATLGAPDVKDETGQPRATNGLHERNSARVNEAETWPSRPFVDMQLATLAAFATLSPPRPPQKYTMDRRALLGGSAALLTTSALPPQLASAIVNGERVSNAEAASAGVVGLYIDLTGCKVCRKGVPATCTGTLIAPNLVLSAKHCADVPASLNGTLTKLVFASEMLEENAPYREVEKMVSTSDYGIDTAGNDLLLIKMKVCVKCKRTVLVSRQ